MGKFSKLFFLGMATFLTANPCWALWNIDTLVNKWKSPVLVGVPFATGTSSNVGDGLAARGNLVLGIPGQGDVFFEDKGHNTPCSRPYWGVSITYNDQQWGFYYDGGGRINVSINDDGSVSFAPASEGSQVVIGSGPPVCRLP